MVFDAADLGGLADAIVERGAGERRRRAPRRGVCARWRWRGSIERRRPHRLARSRAAGAVREAAREGQRQAARALQPPPVRRVSGPGGVGDWPLSLDQERFWFMEQLEPSRAGLNIGAASRLRGHLSVPVVAAALDEIVRRHAAWRTTFPVLADGPVQRVAPSRRQRLAVVDLSGLPAARREPEALRLVGRGRGHPFRPRTRAAGAGEPAAAGRGRPDLPADGPPPGRRLPLLPDRLGRSSPPSAPPSRPAGLRSCRRPRALSRLRRLAARVAPGGGAGGPRGLVARGAGGVPARPRAPHRPAAPGGDADAGRPAHVELLAGAAPRRCAPSRAARGRPCSWPCSPAWPRCSIASPARTG